MTRAGDVLDLFTPDRPEWGVTEAAGHLGIPKSKAHNLLVSLVEIGLLQRGRHGRYRLGWRSVALASTVLRTAAITTGAGPVMRDLATTTQGTVHLVAQDRLRLVCLVRRHPVGDPTPRPPSVGSVLPLDAAPGALVVLADCRHDLVTALWAGGRIRTGHATLEDLNRDRRDIRARGWARDGRTGSDAGTGFAAPIRDGEGQLVAALSLALAPRPGTSPSGVGPDPVVAAATRISEWLQGQRLPAGDAARSGRFARSPLRSSAPAPPPV